MDLLEKIDVLGESARFDICRGCGTHDSRVKDDLGRWIYPAVRPDGKRIDMLKVLQSNVCEKDCAYCANRSDRDVHRVSFRPDELARGFSELLHRGRVQGLFLSSGVCGSVAQATERMLATVEILRRRYLFGGYIHLKILPGADDASIEAAVRMADRVSVNLEAPNARRIGALSKGKDFERDLLTPLRRADRIRQHIGRRVSMTTQFVVGAAGECDSEILTTSTQLYSGLRLARAYYSAFQPISDTPLEDHAPTPSWREHRLYQADFLLRQYGFGLSEIVFQQDGNLAREVDPKLQWAIHHPEFFPLEINDASPEELLRVPGIGPVSARRIVQQRRQARLRDLSHFRVSGADSGRAAPFILLDGKRPSFQLALW
jgi:predicted DNA-binding helix-hairpin-helix protein